MKKKITALVLAVIMCLSFIISAAAADTLKRVPSKIPGTGKEYNYVENVTVKIPGTNVTFDFENVADFVCVDNKVPFYWHDDSYDFYTEYLDIPSYNFCFFENDGKVVFNQEGLIESTHYVYINGEGFGEWDEAISVKKGECFSSKTPNPEYGAANDVITHLVFFVLNDDSLSIDAYNYYDDSISSKEYLKILEEKAVARIDIKIFNFYCEGFDSFYDFNKYDKTIDISTLGVNYTTDEEYKITDGANTVVNSDTKSLKIRADGDFSKFTGVKVDGKAVDSSNYTASKGSTIVEFKGEYLNTLSAGKHTVEILFTDGKATTQFEIKQDKNTDKTDKPQSPNVEIPNTDSSSSVTSAFAVMALSGMALITFKKKKEK